MFQIEILGENEESVKINPEDFGLICRLCLKRNGSIHLFDKKQKEFRAGRFKELLSSLSLLNVDKNDGLPQKICRFCSTLVNEFYLFKEQINACQVILQVALGKINADKNETTYVDVKEQNINNQEEIKNEKHQMLMEEIEKIEINDNFVYKDEFEDTDSDFGVIQRDDYINDIIEVKPPLPIHFEEKFEEPIEYECPVCGETFEERTQFLRHRRAERKKFHAFATRITCTICGKLIVKGRIEDHMNTHTKDKPHKCDICGKGFGSKPNLYSHKVTHRKIKPHICEVCGKGFVQAPALREHLILHKQEYSYMCDICGFKTRTSVSLKQHQRKHSGDLRNPSRSRRRNYYSKVTYCEICKKDFGTYQRMAFHMNTHSGARPFQCSECSKSFKQPSHLHTHMRLHTGEKPYTCDFCGKGFALNGNLKQHVQTHTGERPHPCDTCEKTFYTNSSLRKHRRIHQKIEVVVYSDSD